MKKTILSILLVIAVMLGNVACQSGNNASEEVGSTSEAVALEETNAVT